MSFTVALIIYGVISGEEGGGRGRNGEEWGGDNPSDRGKVEPGLHDKAYSKIILPLVQA